MFWGLVKILGKNGKKITSVGWIPKRATFLAGIFFAGRSKISEEIEILAQEQAPAKVRGTNFASAYRAGAPGAKLL